MGWCPLFNILSPCCARPLLASITVTLLLGSNNFTHRTWEGGGGVISKGKGKKGWGKEGNGNGEVNKGVYV